MDLLKFKEELAEPAESRVPDPKKARFDIYINGSFEGVYDRGTVTGAKRFATREHPRPGTLIRLQSVSYWLYSYVRENGRWKEIR